MLGAALPYVLADGGVWAHQLEVMPAESQLAGWVAERDGRLVGFTNAFIPWWTPRRELGAGGVCVHPDEARHGIGSKLLELAEKHLRSIGAKRVRFSATEDHEQFIVAHGYHVASRKRVSAVDPRTLVGKRDTRLVSYAELGDRLEELYRLDLETSKDIPNDAEFSVPFEDWQSHVWDDPLLAHEGSFAAVVEGRLAAATNLRVAGARAGSGFTGTLREFRGRGLAVAVKTASLVWAAEHGVEWAHTFNDETNAPMLRVNDRLGYRPWIVSLDVERIL